MINVINTYFFNSLYVHENQLCYNGLFTKSETAMTNVSYMCVFVCMFVLIFALCIVRFLEELSGRLFLCIDRFLEELSGRLFLCIVRFLEGLSGRLFLCILFFIYKEWLHYDKCKLYIFVFVGCLLVCLFVSSFFWGVWKHYDECILYVYLFPFLYLIFKNLYFFYLPCNYISIHQFNLVVSVYI